MGPDAMIFVFWMLSFKPTFSLSTFTFIKRPFSSSSLSAIRVVSSEYPRLLIFLPEIPYINGIIKHLSLSLWLISLHRFPSKSIHVVANGTITFFYDYYSIECIYHILIHLSIINSAPMNIEVYIFISCFIFLSTYPGVKFLDCIIVLFLIFLGNSVQFSIKDEPIYIPNNRAQGFLFLHILINTC